MGGPPEARSYATNASVISTEPASGPPTMSPTLETPSRSKSGVFFAAIRTSAVIKKAAITRRPTNQAASGRAGLNARITIIDAANVASQKQAWAIQNEEPPNRATRRSELKASSS